MRRTPKLDMEKQLAEFRAAREAKESGEHEAAEFHRETERKQREGERGRLNEAIDRLDDEDKQKYMEDWRSRNRFSDQRSGERAYRSEYSVRHSRRREWAGRLFGQGMSVEGIIDEISGAREAREQAVETRELPTDNEARSSDKGPKLEPYHGPQLSMPDRSRAHVVHVASEPPAPRRVVEVVASEPPAPAPVAAVEESPVDDVVLGQDWRTIIAERTQSEDYSLNELARESGVDVGVISRFIAGKRDIRLETAQALCAALDLVLVPREWIGRGEEG